MISRCLKLLVVSVAALVMACAPEEISDKAQLECMFQVTPVETSDGALVFDNARLQTTGVDITGIRNESETIAVMASLPASENSFMLIGQDPHQPLVVDVAE